MRKNWGWVHWVSNLRFVPEGHISNKIYTMLNSLLYSRFWYELKLLMMDTPTLPTHQINFKKRPQLYYPIRHPVQGQIVYQSHPISCSHIESLLVYETWQSLKPWDKFDSFQLINRSYPPIPILGTTHQQWYNNLMLLEWPVFGHFNIEKHLMIMYKCCY